MSTGAGPGAGVIASGIIQVNADLTNFATAIGKIPDSMRSQARAAMSALQKELARTKAEFDRTLKADPAAFGGISGKIAAIQALAARETELSAAITKVSGETRAQAYATDQAKTAMKAKAQADRDAAKASRDAAKASNDQAKAAAQAAREQARAAREALAAHEKAGILGTIMSPLRQDGGFLTSPIGGKKDPKDPNKKNSNIGYGMLMMSQAAEDAQYGMAAVVNNIPGLVMALGLGPGVAGVASIAAIAISQLSQRFGSLKEVLGTVYLKNISQQIEEIGKKGVKTADDLSKLSKLNAIQSGVESQKQRPSRETERQDLFNKSIVEYGKQDIENAIRQTHPVLKNKVDQNLIEEKNFAESRQRSLAHSGDSPIDWAFGISNKQLQERVKNANEAITAAYGEAVANFISEIGTDKEKLNAFIREVESNPSAYGGKIKSEALAKNLKEAAMEPDERRERDQNREMDRIEKQYQHELFLKAQQKEKEQRGMSAYAIKLDNMTRNDPNGFDYAAEESHAQRVESEGMQRQADFINDAFDRGIEKFSSMALEGPNRVDAISGNSEALRASILKQLREEGYSEDDIKILIARIMSEIAESVKQENQKRANKEGIGVAEARQRSAHDERISQKEQQTRQLLRDPLREEQDAEFQLQHARGVAADRDFVGPKIGNQDKSRLKSMTPRALKQMDVNNRALSRKKETQDRMNENRRRRIMGGTAKGKLQLADEDASKKKLGIEVDNKIKGVDAVNREKQDLEEISKNSAESIKIANEQKATQDRIAAACEKMTSGVPAVVGGGK